MPVTGAPEAMFRSVGDDLRGRVIAFINAAKNDARGGLTFTEFGRLAFSLVTLCMATADEYRGLPGAERKKWVMAAAEVLFDSLLPLLPLPARIPGVSSMLKSVFLAVVSGAIESLLPTVRAAA